MNQRESQRQLVFEYCDYVAARRSDAEQDNIPYKPLTMKEFMRHRKVKPEDVSLELPRLKPCPFCKGKPELAAHPNLDTTWHYVLCRCGVRGPMFSEHRHLAVQGWNRMARRE